MKVLDGKAALLSVRIDNTFYAVLCATRVRVSIDHEEVLKTSRNSTHRERQLRIPDWGIQLDGLTKIDNSDGQISWFWLLNNAGSEIFIRIRYTDAAGTTKDFSGNVLIKQGSLDSMVGGFSMASLYLPGTGAFSTDPVSAVSSSDLYKLYLSTTEGAYEVSHNDLGGATEIMLVIREDGQYIETTGTPSGRQFKYTDNTTSGKLTFDSSLVFNAGEIVYVEYKKPA